MQPVISLQRKQNLSLKENSTEQFVLLTFGMIPHITQERRAENNIHHTGRIDGIVVDAEKMWRVDWPLDCLPDNLCLSGLEGGQGGCRVPHAVPMTSWRQNRTLQSPNCISPLTCKRMNPVYMFVWQKTNNETINIVSVIQEKEKK